MRLTKPSYSQNRKTVFQLFLQMALTLKLLTTIIVVSNLVLEPVGKQKTTTHVSYIGFSNTQT